MSMDSQHLDQSLQNLTFHLFNRPLHPELFTIYERRHFFQGDYEVQMWITGCNHVVSVFAGGYCMTELVCPLDQLLPRRGLIERFAFKRNKKYSCTWPNGMVYLLNADVEPTSAGVYRHTYNDLHKLSRQRGVFVEYPHHEADEADTPPSFSYVDYEAGRDELQIYTYHAAPELQSVLKTQSLFKLTPKRRRRKA